MYGRPLLTKRGLQWLKLNTTTVCSEQLLFPQQQHLAMLQFHQQQQCYPGEIAELGGTNSISCSTNVKDVLPKVVGFPVFGELPYMGKLSRTHKNLSYNHMSFIAFKICPGFCVAKSCIHTSSTLVAGHNKWSKVKYIKGPKDHQRSLLASKIHKQMRVVIKEGGANPETNPELARLIALAKSQGLPKATIENGISNAVNAKDKGGTQYICEGQGPKGSAIVVEYITDNQNRSRYELAQIFKAHGCTVGGQGSVLYAFSRKGVIELSSAENKEPMTFDLAMELAIEAGAEDVAQEEEEGRTVFKFMCDQADFRSVRAALGGTNHELGIASLEFIPESNVALSPQELEKMGALIMKLEEHPSVLKVSHNIVEEM